MNFVGRPRWAELLEEERRGNEAEPITPSALEAEGWSRPIHYWIQEPPADKPLTDNFVAVETVNAVPGHLWVYIISDGKLVPFRGVRTMQQLRALVEMLEGTSP